MLTDLPRFFGNPQQIYVTTKFTYDRFIETFNGKTPCFISTYRFPTMLTPIVDLAIFDIDSKLNLRYPYRDTKALKDFCDKNDIPYVIDFSGGKGFHFFMITKPEEGNEQVKDKLYSIQLSLINNLGITSMDLPTIGRLRWLIRIPCSKYVRIDKKTKKKEVNGLYCRNLTGDEFEKGLDYILKLAKEPGITPKRPPAKQTLDDIINLIPKFQLKHRYNGFDNLEIMQSAQSTLTPTLCAVGLPCLQMIAKQKHPSHFERVELVAWLKFQGYRDTNIIGFIKSLGWNKFDLKDTTTNVLSIKPRLPKCSWLGTVFPEECKNCSFKKRN